MRLRSELAKFSSDVDRRAKEAARMFAALGGKAKSKKKAAASRANGKKGGRPKKVKPEDVLLLNHNPKTAPVIGTVSHVVVDGHVLKFKYKAAKLPRKKRK